MTVTTDAVVLQAPVKPNINHHETVFGGSASALAILAAWTLIQVRFRAEGLDYRLVIQQNTMEYIQPIPGQFTAHASLEDPEAWQKFTRVLARKGKARIAVSSTLVYANQVNGRFSGKFVALSMKNT